jgi:hypothetical protein
MAANPTVTVVDGDALLTGGGFKLLLYRQQINHTNVANVGARSITTLKIEKGKVDIAPSFSVQLRLKLVNCGSSRRSYVADVKPRIELTADTPKE